MIVVSSNKCWQLKGYYAHGYTVTWGNNLCETIHFSVTLNKREVVLT